MTTSIDHLTAVATTHFLGSEPPGTAYYGQTFKAAGYQLDSVEFLIDGLQGPDATDYKVLITTATFDATGFHPGTVLFESGPLSEPFDANHALHHVTVDTSNIALTPGQTYAFILDAFDLADGLAGTAQVGVSFSGGSAGTNYADGSFVFLNATSGDRASHFAADWKGDAATDDLSFRLTFNVEGATIVGTKHKDVIDASHTAKGQPFPTSDDDIISGRGGNDKVFALAGNDFLRGGSGNDGLHGGDGEDLLSGGKGKDRLFGEAGPDAFRFDSSLKEPADKIMDFVAADDTILFSGKIFKVLGKGPLAEGAFNAGGKEEHDDRILYRQGKLLYDDDGKGGNDPVFFAKVAGSPALAFDDFAIVT